MAVVKCAIELGVADAIENHGSPMPLSELAATLRCKPSRLHCIMRIQSYYPWHSLNVRVLESGDILPFEAANGMDLWSYTEANPGHSKLFNDTTACSSRHTISAILEGCPQVFDGVESLVDVGGGNGTALSVLVSNSQGFEASTSISLMFSAVAPTFDIIENVGDDMFMSIPNDTFYPSFQQRITCLIYE
ncbi:Geranylgeranyl reductase [Hibiscus syriacus]|uniref:Geranylgeranyl reductase n=1 Tax=Hibiscus syriacus TaxID=106335 RepID=A0A6A2ZKY2_HIBSY|nr:Geranylgeranyl reductase [Hibiscus syriacus]